MRGLVRRQLTVESEGSEGSSAGRQAKGQAADARCIAGIEIKIKYCRIAAIDGTHACVIKCLDIFHASSIAATLATNRLTTVRILQIISLPSSSSNLPMVL